MGGLSKPLQRVHEDFADDGGRGRRDAQRDERHPQAPPLVARALVWSLPGEDHDHVGEVEPQHCYRRADAEQRERVAVRIAVPARNGRNQQQEDGDADESELQQEGAPVEVGVVRAEDQRGAEDEQDVRHHAPGQ